MNWLLSGCLAKTFILLLFVLSSSSSTIGDDSGDGVVCPGDEWSLWEDCEGCLPNKRRVCKTNSSIFEEEECNIGSPLKL